MNYNKQVYYGAINMIFMAYVSVELQNHGSILLKPSDSYQLKETAWQGNYYCVPLCTNLSGQQKERELLGLSKVSFHSLPKDKNMLRKWIVKIKRDPGPNFVINQYTKICTEHFTLDDYFPTSDKPNSRHRLKPNAVPSVFQ